MLRKLVVVSLVSLFLCSFLMLGTADALYRRYTWDIDMTEHDIRNIGNLDAENAVIQNLSATTVHVTNITVDSITIATVFITDATIINADITNADITNLTADTAFVTNATIINLSATDIQTDNLSADTAFITDFTAIDATITNTDITNLTADTAFITNGTIVDLSATNIGVDNLTATTAFITNATIINAEITNITGATAVFGNVIDHTSISDIGQITLAGSARVYINLRPELDASVIAKHTNVPTSAERGAFTGYSLPPYTPASNEELSLRAMSPHRWDGVSNPMFMIHCYLASAEDPGDSFSIEIGWQQSTEGTVLSGDTVSLSTTTVVTGTGAQYSVYHVSLEIDYDYYTPPLMDMDTLGIRVRRVDTDGTELDGELVIYDWHIQWRCDKFGTPI